MNFRFLIPVYIFLLTAAMFGWWYSAPEQMIFSGGLLIIGYFAAAWWLTSERNDWWCFALTPVLLALASISFGLLIPGSWLLGLMLAIVTILEAVYWGYAFRYASHSPAYQPFSLERLSASFHFLTIFFVAATAFGLRTYLDFPFSLIAPIFSALVCVLVLQWIWVSKTSFSKSWRFGLVAALVVIETAYVATFFPLDYRLLGFLVASTYYAIMYLVASSTAGTLTKRQLRLIAAVIVLCWLAVFLSGRWL